MKPLFPLVLVCQAVQQCLQTADRNFSIKDDATPVTPIDCAIETALRALILQYHPQDTIIGEEFPDHMGKSDTTYVIDPIDGTKAFLCGKPTFMTLLGMMHRGKPVFGAAYQPSLDALWWTDDNQTFHRSGKNSVTSQRTSKTTQLIDARISTTSPHLFSDPHKIIFEALESHIDQQRKNKHGSGFVSYGGDAYQYVLLASGSLDIVMEDQLKVCDILPLIPIIEQAGGIITTWTGKPIVAAHFDGHVIAAANETLHQQCLDFIHKKQ